MIFLRPPLKNPIKTPKLTLTRKEKLTLCIYWSVPSFNSTSGFVTLNDSKGIEILLVLWKLTHRHARKIQISIPVKKMLQYVLYSYIN